ncbi:uncharacterized protein TRIVIDRAFT_42624 [Trichoderma virens Gv29-8]|uniref:NAD-dependent epimerase/dehydratase domain-containing protein n=1 Tax=Hypocrea virens (strain Gv29-8 / FGSC 10586) TaxID=413071 RepID=G9N8R6_HYPVG|nr:uncharacterized protein TRIVIDRAFT_42624 [Trichoderma virens Gv29-8]EHK17371.1 hypothetical protein TRIVIDRAFT_42624 [Trichoderma virens Gv29-8]
MAWNILITGAAGYIGGSHVIGLLGSETVKFEPENINVLVRSGGQVGHFSKLGINAIQCSLLDEKKLADIVLERKVDIIVHCASSLDPNLAYPLILALQKSAKPPARRYILFTSDPTQTAEMGAFSKETGWPHGSVEDTDPVFELEKQMPEQDVFPVQRYSKPINSEGTNLINNPFCGLVDGRGTGPYKKLSVQVPSLIRAFIVLKMVYKFDYEGRWPAAHVSDVVNYYILLIGLIIEGKTPPSGENGYYFAATHYLSWWKMLEGLAISLHGRGLVKEPIPVIWPSVELAEKALGFPSPYVQVAFSSRSPQGIADKRYSIGWEPKWNAPDFFNIIDDEVQSVLDLDIARACIADYFANEKLEGSKE